MEHQFCVELASCYGIEEAIIIQNLYFWIKKNVANEKNFYDGRYWTYNSSKAFSSLFPYMTESKIYRVLKSLEEKGLIIKGNYNDNKYDRTCWYALSDKAIKELTDLKYDAYGFSRSILQNENYDFAKMQNGNNENVKPIPDSKHTDNKTNKEITDKSIPNKGFDFKRALLDLGIEENIVNDWLLVRKQKKATNTETAFKRIKNEIALSGISANECITLAVERCWMGFKAEWVKNAASSYKSQNNSLFSQQPNIIELHPALKQIDENGTLNDGTYLKNGFRYYFSKTSLSAVSIPPKAEPKPQGDNFEYDYKLGWYECE